MLLYSDNSLIEYCLHDIFAIYIFFFLCISFIVHCRDLCLALFQQNYASKCFENLEFNLLCAILLTRRYQVNYSVFHSQSNCQSS